MEGIEVRTYVSRDGCGGINIEGDMIVLAQSHPKYKQGVNQLDIQELTVADVTLLIDKLTELKSDMEVEG